MTTIIVGVDGSASAACALDWAVREGAHRGWPVRAVLAWHLMDQPKIDAGDPFDPAFDDASAAKVLDHRLVEALGADAATMVERAVVCDLPAAALIDATGPDDVLVVGARGLGGFKGALLGSVSQKCLHHATSTVVVVRDVPDRPHDEVGRIVVGVDGSESAAAALQWAVAAARARRARLEVVHAWHLPYVGGPGYGAVSIDPTPFEQGALDLVAKAVETSGADGLEPEVQTRVVAESAASAILDAASDADLVVVGSHGAGGFAGMLLGSVSQHVATHAPCPVAVVPSPAVTAATRSLGGTE